MISLEGIFFPSQWVAFEMCCEEIKKEKGAAWERGGGELGTIYLAPLLPVACHRDVGTGTCPPWRRSEERGCAPCRNLPQGLQGQQKRRRVTHFPVFPHGISVTPKHFMC